MISHERAQRTSEISCSTREINLVFPSIHVFFCLYSFWKAKFLQKSDNWKAIIFTCKIIINNLTNNLVALNLIKHVSCSFIKQYVKGRKLYISCSNNFFLPDERQIAKNSNVTESWPADFMHVWSFIAECGWLNFGWESKTVGSRSEKLNRKIQHRKWSWSLNTWGFGGEMVSALAFHL
jgi:hypothetical protein